jgi:predicted TPR repeat methyltransferase
MPARLFMSSGDMIADRRFDYARDLQLSGDLVAAADLFEQATDLAPGFATAWFTLGEVREQLGDNAGAILAFRNARRTDAGDRNGAGLRLMRLGDVAVASMPPTYVSALFDQYAPKFDVALGDLGYCGPAVLLKAVHESGAGAAPAFFHHVIDLGCGTGLAARAFAADNDGIIGIDLSPRMIELARATGLYTTLEVADIVEALVSKPNGSADLILAADVMVYVHDVAPLLAEAARVLMPGGLLALTAETHGGGGVVLVQGLRYAHGRDHLRSSIAAAGLTLLLLEPASSRNESGVPVPGLVAVAAKHQG